MDSKQDDTNTIENGAADRASKQQFLDALLAADHESASFGSDRESIENAGVVLSSNPDPIDLPGAPAGRVKARSEAMNRPNKPEIMYSIEKGSSNDDADDPVVDDAGTIPVAGEQSANVDKDLLLLSCPKCNGQLAIREEHVGVEGACVWCDAPIVAARAGGNRVVKVFAIAPVPEAELETSAADSTGTEEAGASPNETPELSGSSQTVEPSSFVESEMPSGWGAPAPAEKVAETTSEFNQPETEKTEVESSQVEESAALSLPAEATGFPEREISTGWEAPTPTEKAPDTTGEFSPTETESPDEPALSPAPQHQQEETPPHKGTGAAIEAFDEPNEDKDIFEGFSGANPSPEDESNQPSSHGSGFGEFLSSASGKGKEAVELESAPKEDAPSVEPKKEEEFSSPTPWGPPTQPAAAEPQISPENKSPVPDSSDVPPSVDNDSPPETTSSNDAVLPAEWGTPGEAPLSSETEPTPNPSIGFGSPTNEDEAPIPFTEAETETPAIPANDSEALFPETPPSHHYPEDTGGESPVGFNIPSSESSNSPFPSFGTTDEAPEPLDEEKVTEAIQDESFPEFEANEENIFSPSEPAVDAASLFGAPSQGGASLFGDPNESKAPPSTGTPSNPFGEEKPVEKSIPEEDISSASAQEQQEAEATDPATPSVDSVTLGKKKKGKGFFIISAIILGLVCGAALASFVLPVDEYVSRARSLMEQKFMPSATWESAENTTAPEQPEVPSSELNN